MVILPAVQSTDKKKEKNNFLKNIETTVQSQ